MAIAGFAAQAVAAVVHMGCVSAGFQFGLELTWGLAHFKCLHDPVAATRTLVLPLVIGQSSRKKQARGTCTADPDCGSRLRTPRPVRIRIRIPAPAAMIDKPAQQHDISL